MYSVSSLGRIRRDVDGRGGWKAGLILKWSKSENQRYFRVQLTHPSTYQQTTHLVHKLVAIAFIGPRPEGAEINHKDTDKSNNRADNIEYLTKQDHIKHTLMHNNNYRGESNGNAKYTAGIIREIRRVYAEGNVTYESLAVKYKTTECHIGRIIRKTHWKYID